MTNIEVYLERAEDEWDCFTLEEKVQAIDPERDLDLLIEFADEFKETEKIARAIRHTTIHEFLDKRFKSGWIQMEAEERKARDADYAYDCAKDEGII